jgi:hypothetical protein
MTPEAQRIAIAEACGWKWVEIEDEGFWWVHTDKDPQADCPDYLNDLNRTQEAILSLSYEQQQQWLYELGRVVGCANRNDWRISDMVNATASQRAEAFLRTLNLWVE